MLRKIFADLIIKGCVRMCVSYVVSFDNLSTSAVPLIKCLNILNELILDILLLDIPDQLIPVFKINPPDLLIMSHFKCKTALIPPTYNGYPEENFSV